MSRGAESPCFCFAFHPPIANLPTLCEVIKCCIAVPEHKADFSAEIVTAPKVKIVACKSGDAVEGKKGKAD